MQRVKRIVCTATICPNDARGDRRTGENKCRGCFWVRYVEW